MRLNNRYEHTIFFSDRAAQENYFASKVVKTLGAYTYIRRTWDLKVEGTPEEARAWNYLLFRNTPDGKVYYYFINSVEYVNDATVKLVLEMDVMQTYMFDYSPMQCFIERQHVSRDTAGAYTLDEGLEVGEFIVNETVDFSALNEYCILVLSTITLNGTSQDTTVDSLSGMYGGVFSGLSAWAIKASDWAAWGQQLENISEWGKIDGIVSMSMYPKALVQLGGESSWDDDDLAKVVKHFTTPTMVSMGLSGLPATVNGYTPRNKKVLCYPFNFIYATNNAGTSAVYRFERFSGDAVRFNAVGAIGPNAGVQVYPLNYNGVPENYHEGIALGNFPTCAWDSDTYKVWLAQNENQQGVAMASAGLTIAGGAVTGIAGLLTGNLGGAAAGAGAAIAGATQIANTLAQRADMSIVPPQARGSFSSSVNATNGKHTITFQRKSVTKEHAQIIDEYFDMYGYKLNIVDVPNRHARELYTYVKTIGCIIAANLCTEDAAKIESIYDKGITFWTNGDLIGNYQLDNKPIEEV